DWDVAFNEDAGLTFVYKNTVANSGTFRVQNHSAPGAADTSFQAVTGLPTVSSRSNNERLALYSLDFGSEEIISIEDVTNSVSTLSLKSGNNAGLTATNSGRDGLGLLAGQADNLANIRGGKFSAVGE